MPLGKQVVPKLAATMNPSAISDIYLADDEMMNRPDYTRGLQLLIRGNYQSWTSSLFRLTIDDSRRSVQGKSWLDSPCDS